MNRNQSALGLKQYISYSKGHASYSIRTAQFLTEALGQFPVFLSFSPCTSPFLAIQPNRFQNCFGV
jgi:hypothetical protein